MLPSTITKKLLPSKVDSLRERELYRYYKPPDSPTASGKEGEGEDGKVQDNTLSVSPISSPDTTLTALSQLCCVRLNAQRSMIRQVTRGGRCSRMWIEAYLLKA